MRWMLVIVTLTAAGSLLSFSAQDKNLDSPEERQKAFMQAMLKGDVEEGYETLMKNSVIMKDNAEAVENLIEQTENGITLYAGAKSFDQIGVSSKGNLVKYGTAVLGCKKAPLFFYFIWYRESEKVEWRITNVWFNDQSKEFLTGQTWMK